MSIAASPAPAERPVARSLETFREWLKERGLKTTSQREDIARVFLNADRHISVEELYAEVKKVNPRVGYATVYRMLRLLKECGLAVERHFNDGEARFERAEGEKRAHDHFICERCGGSSSSRASRSSARPANRQEARRRDHTPSPGALRHLPQCREGEGPVAASAQVH